MGEMNVSRNAAANAAASRAPQSDLSQLSECANGDVGERIALLQSVLNQKGARDFEGKPLKTDQKFGPRTESAVKAFQESCGLPQTGKVDAGTLAALRGEKVEPQTTTAGAANPASTATATAAAAAPTPDKTKVGADTVRAGRERAAADAANTARAVRARVPESVASADTGLSVADAAVEIKARQAAAQERLDTATAAFQESDTQVKAFEARGKPATVQDQAALDAARTRRTAAEANMQVETVALGMLDEAQRMLGDGKLDVGEAAGMANMAQIDERNRGIAAQAEGVAEAATKAVGSAERLRDLARAAGAAAPGVVEAANAGQPVKTATGTETAAAPAAPAKGAAQKVPATTTTAATAAKDKVEATATGKADKTAPAAGAATPADKPVTGPEIEGKLRVSKNKLREAKANLDDLRAANKSGPEVAIAEARVKTLEQRTKDLEGFDAALKGNKPVDAKAVAASQTAFDAEMKTLDASSSALKANEDLKASILKNHKSIDAFVASREQMVREAEAGLKGAQSRGDETGILAARNRLEAQKADLSLAKSIQAHIQQTDAALGNDGRIDAKEKAGIDKAGADRAAAEGDKQFFLERFKGQQDKNGWWEKSMQWLDRRSANSAVTDEAMVGMYMGA